jgi:nicotinate-nucleotide adenylyltransferase
VNKKRIGFFGGSFNPIHVGHVLLAKALLRAVKLDEVWFVVSPLNPFKYQSASLLEDSKRLEMVKIVLEGEKKFKVSDVEFNLPKPSYTINTLHYFSKTYLDYDFVLLIGADNWVAFDRWNGHEQILRDYEIAIYPRKDVYIDVTQLPQNVCLVDTPLLNISSTEIRKMLKSNQSIRGLIPDSIYDKVIKYYKE